MSMSSSDKKFHFLNESHEGDARVEGRVISVECCEHEALSKEQLLFVLPGLVSCS